MTLHQLILQSFGCEEASVQYPLLDSVRATHGMTVLWDDVNGVGTFLSGNHVDRLSDDIDATHLVFHFPSD